MVLSYYDIIIIGSGMAGLFSAYNIKNISPETSFLILEKNPKKLIGGRAGHEMFYGTRIVTGAGIGRKPKDKLLLKLVKDLNIPFKFFEVNPNYSKLVDKVDITKIMDILREKYDKLSPSEKEEVKAMTFGQFAKSVLGLDLYKKFIISTGYSDYVNADVEETLYNYGMDDNACCWEGFGFSWSDLVAKLYNYIGPEHFKFNNMVTKISKLKFHPLVYTVETNNGSIHYARKIIIAGTIQTIRNLLPTYQIYKQIESQPFLRLYGKFSNNSIPIMKKYIQGYTVLPGPLQKIIPMDVDKGVYMIAYNDNTNTITFKNHLKNNETNRELFAQFLEASIGIPKNSLQLIAIKPYYWTSGTHYYKPLNKKKYKSRDEFVYLAQHPANGIIVAGEVVSQKQGWVEGALESVKTVINKNWIDTKF